MIDMLKILVILSFSGVFLLVIYMNYLNKLINKLEKKIDTLQLQTDDVLHKLSDCESRLNQLEEALELKEYFDKESLNKKGDENNQTISRNNSAEWRI